MPRKGARMRLCADGGVIMKDKQDIQLKGQLKLYAVAGNHVGTSSGNECMDL